MPRLCFSVCLTEEIELLSVSSVKGQVHVGPTRWLNKQSDASDFGHPKFQEPSKRNRWRFSRGVVPIFLQGTSASFCSRLSMVSMETSRQLRRAQLSNEANL